MALRQQQQPICCQVTGRVVGPRPIRAQGSLPSLCRMSSGSSGLTGFSLSEMFTSFLGSPSSFLTSCFRQQTLLHALWILSLSRVSLDPLHPRHTSTVVKYFDETPRFLLKSLKRNPSDTRGVIPEQITVDPSVFFLPGFYPQGLTYHNIE